MEENKNKPGFTVPEGYFEALDARVLAKLKEVPLPENNGFTVPEGYFDAVEDTILKTSKTAGWEVHVTKTPKQQNSTNKSIWYSIAGIAAVLAVVFTLYPFGNGTVSLEDINSTSISAYLEEGSLELTPDEIATYLNDEDFDALMVASEEISEENLSEYLYNHLDDNSLLIE